MAASGSVLGLVGSPNREGRTYRMVTATLEGAARAGARVDLVQMADHVVEACRDCLPWECMTTLRCRYPDPAIARGLAQADLLAARGESLRSLREITRAYEAGVKVFEANQG